MCTTQQNLYFGVFVFYFMIISSSIPTERLLIFMFRSTLASTKTLALVAANVWSYRANIQCHKVIPLMWIQLNIYDRKYFTFQYERREREKKENAVHLVCAVYMTWSSWVRMYACTMYVYFGNGRVKFSLSLPLWLILNPFISSVLYSNRLRCKQTHFRNTIVAWFVWNAKRRWNKPQTKSLKMGLR